RRGFNVLQEELPIGYADKIFFFQDYLFAHHGDLFDGYELSYIDPSDGYSTWTTVSGTYQAPEGRRIQTLLANQSCYFTTSEGVFKLDGYGNTPELAGAYKA